MRVNLAIDPALPQRDLLLDVGEVVRRLSARLGSAGPIKIDSCERLRIKYSPGASLRLLHRMQIGTASYTVAAHAFTEGRSKPAFERAKEKAISCEPLLPIVRDAELDTVFWTFPNERKITNLSALQTPPARLANLFDSNWTRSRIVAYAPEKCVTAECLNDEGELLAYAKVYSDGEPSSFALYDRLWQSISAARSSLRIPRALAYSEECRTLFLEPIAGRRITDLSSAARPDGFRRLGAALAALHSLAVPDDLPPFSRLDPDRLQKAAVIIGQARPDVRELADEVAKELCEMWTAPADSRVCLHGDVHPKNGIIQNSHAALIDLDQAGAGPAAADLGSLLAALRYSRCVGILSPADERRLRRAFLSGYSEVRELPERRCLRWHVAAALLAERALRSVSRIRQEGLHRLNELLIDCRRLLSEERYE
ncbi:MAG TPA: phosphotransferase [Blastocatellia bacterium]|nr:phosphotransferase [Blastocatellia bacterium]